jgi:hypothetical protein
MLVANPISPIPVQIRAHDTCRWDGSADQLHDTIERRLMVVPLGRVTMRLRPEGRRTERASS